MGDDQPTVIYIHGHEAPSSIGVVKDQSIDAETFETSFGEFLGAIPVPQQIVFDSCFAASKMLEESLVEVAKKIAGERVKVLGCSGVSIAANRGERSEGW